jgi:dephospho-CoA kinase
MGILKIGLTGGIASGKTTIAGIFKELGAEIIDADLIARKVSQKGTSVYKEIVKAFGKNCLKKDGEIDRKKIGKIIFESPDKRKLLNAIIHPEIFKKERLLEREIKKRNKHAVILYDIPLLIETGSFAKMESVVLVHVKRETQISRLMKRNRLTRDESLNRIQAQLPFSQKKKYADYLIRGDETRDKTVKRVKKIYSEILRRYSLNH